MEILKTAVISVCITSIAVGIIESVLPNNSHKRQLRLLTGAVIILSIISPFSKAGDLNYPNYSSETVAVDINESLQNIVAVSAKNEISEILKTNGINNAKIIVCTDIDDKNCIVINNAKILLIKNDMKYAKQVIDGINSKLKITAAIDVL